VSSIPASLTAWVRRLREDEISWTFARNASGAFVIGGLGQLAGFLVLLPLAHLMGVESYGIYLYVAAWLQVATMLAGMGIPNAAQRFVPEYLATGREAECGSFLGWANRRVLANSLLLSAAGLLTLGLLHSRISPETLWTGVIAALALPLASGVMLRSRLLLALKETLRAKLVDSFRMPLAVGAAVLIFWMADARLSAAAAMVAQAASALLALVVLGAWLRRGLHSAVSPGRRSEARKLWRGVAGSLFFIGAMGMIMSQADTLMLGAMRGTTEAGIYRTASRLAMLPAFGLSAANTITAPLISELYSQGRMADLQRLATLSARALFGLISGAGLCLLLAGKFVLGLFGPAFTTGYLALAFLTIGQMVNGFCGPVALLMTLTGGHDTAARVFLAAAALNILLNSILIPSHGGIGAAVSTTSSLVLWNVVLVVLVQRRLNIQSVAIAMLRV